MNKQHDRKANSIKYHTGEWVLVRYPADETGKTVSYRDLGMDRIALLQFVIWTFLLLMSVFLRTRPSLSIKPGWSLTPVTFLPVFTGTVASDKELVKLLVGWKPCFLMTKTTKWTKMKEMVQWRCAMKWSQKIPIRTFKQPVKRRPYLTILLQEDVLHLTTWGNSLIPQGRSRLNKLGTSFVI